MAQQPPDRDRNSPPAFPVAIIGLACRLPGANGIAEFWSLLQSGTDAVGEIPRDRWDHDYFYHPDPSRPGRTYAHAGGYLQNIDRFDADFFGISPREVRQMDPQQRILLELTWEALENANLIPSRLAGSDTGVFIGVSSGDYGAMQRLASDAFVDPYVMSGSAFSICANRISYLFDLHGPSVAIDTACSSALVAVHQACASLRTGDSRIAIAGGINVILTPESFVGFAKAGMLSPSGRCRAFDADADGYVRSEGGGIVILKPLDAALADGDPIHAVILDSAVNSDGRTKGIALPNPVAQEALLRRIYGTGIDPAEVAYVEAHGTGTTAGDRVECSALGRVFGPARRAGDPLRIGSVKTNIGHLEPASGMAGLLKAILTLKHREIPPSLHFKTPNPKIRFDELNLAVVRETTRLADGAGPVIVGVNSFGFGGTNAHIALSSYDAPAPIALPPRQTGIAPLFLSARSEAALKALAENHAKLLRSPGGPSLAALGHAVATRRTHHPHRLGLFGESDGEVAAKLEAFAAGQPALMLAQGEAAYQKKRIAFVFTGNGAQWLGMGRDLLAREPLFAECVTRIDRLLLPLVGWSLLDLLQADDDPALYDKTEYAQPALFAVQTGIVALLRARGLDAEAMIGHSVGEVAAAQAAGALSLEEACLLIACRSQAQSRTAGAGKMAAVGLSEAEAAAAIAPYGAAIGIASINSPVSVTLAGEEAALEALGKTLEAKGVFFRLLALDYAFHSRIMEPLRQEVLARLAPLRPQPGPYRFISTVTGGERDGAALDAEYWWTNIRKPVRFAPAIQFLIEDGIEIFLEIGPHPILSGYIRECAQGASDGIAVPATLRRREPEAEALWLALARCYAEGAMLDWPTLFPGAGAEVALPAYPWQRESYWFERSGSIALTHLGPHVHPLLGYRMPVAEPVWKSDIDTGKLTYLRDHVVGGAVLFPAAGYIEMALAAAAAEFATDAVEIEELEIRRPVVLGEKLGAELEFELAPEDHSFRILNNRKDEAAAPPIAVGRVAALAGKPEPQAVDLAALKTGAAERISRDAHYAHCLAHGLAYGPAFQGVAELFASNGEALARIETPASLGEALAQYHLHPAMLDACLQTAIAAIPAAAEAENRQAAYVPVFAARVRLLRKAPIAWCHVTLARADRIAILADFTLLDAAGIPVASLEGVRFQRLDLAATSEIPAYHWQYLPQAARGLSGKSILPSLAEIAAAISWPETEAKLPALDRLAAGYARTALKALGVTQTPFDVAALIRDARLRPETEPYLHALQRLLAQEDGAEEPAALWRQSIADHPDSIASLELAARIGEHLPAILRGETDAESLLFPERDFNAGEQLLDSDPLFRRGKEIAADMVRHIAHAASGRTLRILDLGGGANILAASLLPSLAFDRVEYVLAQRDENALAQAQSAFADYPFLHHRLLDLDRDPVGQGFEGQHYDLILAANALHEAEEIEAATAHLRTLLKPAGLLLLAEAEPSPFLDFVFGLRRHWWSFIDTDRRPHSPLLPAAQWQDLLQAAGFAETRRVGDTGAILLARNAEGNGHAAEATGTAAGRWVVLAGAGPDDLASAMARGLRDAGHPVLTIDENETPLASAEDHRALAARLRDPAAPGFDLLYARQRPGRSNGGEIDPLTRQDEGALGLLLLVQALVEAGLADKVRLWVVTRGAAAALDQGPRDPAQAPIWGAARTLRNERPDLPIRLIDLDPALAAETNAQLLLTEIALLSEEDEIILHGGVRLVPRLMRGLPPAVETSSDEARPYRLALGGRNGADGLVLRPIAQPVPQSGEVTIRVRAGGLNFRDVLQRIGLLPEEAFEGGFAGATLGMEFAGEIEALGPDVTGYRVGDAVLGFAPNAFSSYFTAPAHALFRKPAGMSFEAAATLPVAALTVFYSLHSLARLQPGERILIHGAAGGVGLAAIQYAQSLGAEIFASAGTEAKRDFLRRLGVKHVVDSRSLAFADEIRAATSGEGVDVVLNSLAGEALTRGVGLLRPYGRFIELGKRDFYANTKLGLRPFRNNIQFFGVDVDRLLVDRPKMAAALLHDLAQAIADGVFRPLPHRLFPVTRAAEAFRHMQQSRHIGKVVLTMATAVRTVAEPKAAALALPADATYLVSGGRGGFGLATAEWLASKGARHLVLIGRSAETAPDAAAKIAALIANGVTVSEVALDVTDGMALAALFQKIARELPPLRGIVHSAAVIEDAALANMSTEKFRAVLAPKLLGAWHLDRLSRALPLDFFVMYSSAITLFGNPGQSNYAAANLYLEALGQQRRAAGLPALVMQWGALGGVGHLQRHAEVASTMTDRLGIKLLAPERAFERLEQALSGDLGQVAIADLNWSKLAIIPQLAKSPKYQFVRPGAGEAAESGQDAAALREQLAAMPPAQRYAHVQLLVIKYLAGVLRMPAGKLHVHQALQDLGMDSLMVVELQLAFEQQLGISVSPMELMDVTNVGQLVARIAQKLDIEAPGAEPRPEPPAEERAELDEIDHMSPERLDDMLGQLLARDGGEAVDEEVS